MNIYYIALKNSVYNYEGETVKEIKANTVEEALAIAQRLDIYANVFDVTAEQKKINCERQYATFEEVIERRKRLTGAKDLHVILEPKATPETLQDFFDEVERQQTEYNKYSIEEQLEATIARLRKKFARIRTLVNSGDKNTLSKIFSEADWLVDVDFKEDLEWLRSKNKK